MHVAYDPRRSAPRPGAAWGGPSIRPAGYGLTPSLGAAIQGLLKEYGLEEAANLQRAVPLWKATVGPAIARNCPAVSVEGQTLWVRAKNAAWRSEISFRKDELLDALNAPLDSVRLTDIRYC